MALSRITNPFLSSSGSISTTDNANSALRITQLGTGNALTVEDSTNPDSTPFVITADGRIVSGATSLYPSPVNDANTDKLQLNGATTYDSSADFISWATGTDVGTSLNLARSDSGIIGTHTVVGSADLFGNIRFFGSDGTNFIQGAKISAGADGTPGTNDMPGRLIFSTTADGASSVTERMRIDSAGLVTIASGQIKFPASQNASADANTLDDYEEGTWTPSLGGTTTYGSREGNYTKIGNVVYAEFQLQVTLIGNGDNSRISGLPFTSKAIAGRHGGMLSYYGGIATSVYSIFPYVGGNTTQITFPTSTSLSASITDGSSVIFQNGAYVIGTVVYLTA